jgi:hypothetical protein
MDDAGTGTIGEATQTGSNSMDDDQGFVKMVVVDGIVMGHTVRLHLKCRNMTDINDQYCAFANCTSDLVNARGGVYCAFHENLFGNKCHAANCSSAKVQGTQACETHQGKWRQHLINNRTHALAGYRRALRRPDETLPWMPTTVQVTQPHDEQPVVGRRVQDHFTPPRMYCVETICAPCGVVVAWTKFAKSESPTNILNFLQTVYPTEESRPSYICIDKACLVLHTSVANSSWDSWKKTSRFIVDTYHYVNHRATDALCRKWCNPAPMDGSAPNLVVVERNPNGQLYYKHAFNTQACEQLNAWLGGFEQILKRMTPHNFNWFLHTMLVYHTRSVIKKKEQRERDVEGDEEEDEINATSE